MAVAICWLVNLSINVSGDDSINDVVGISECGRMVVVWTHLRIRECTIANDWTCKWITFKPKRLLIAMNRSIFMINGQ